jgi:hypothetical protein
MLRPADIYAGAVAAFRWEIPARYNIGVDVADKHVLDGHGDQLALIYESESGTVERFSFADIARKSNQLANLLGRMASAPATASPFCYPSGRRLRLVTSPSTRQA